MDNLREKTLIGLFWNLLERVGLRFIQFIPTLILARLLSPEQFGLIGMLAIFLAILQTFLDSGFSMALIQKKDASFIDECSIFYFNIFLGGLAVLVLFLAAPLIAAFYAQPLLTPLTRWLSLDILIGSFSMIQVARLTRMLDFKTLVKANLFATLLSGAFGVLAAYAGLGVWSLVIQTISNTLIFTVTLWLMSAWRPALVFSLDSLKDMFAFGSNMLASSLVSTFFDNIYQVFIGKYFSATSLGYYSRAASLKAVIIDTSSDTVGRVLFPALANIQHDLERLKRAYRKSILMTTFVHFPLMLGLVVVAKPLFNLFFSAKWQESILFFQLMCVASLLYPLHVINLDILKVKGRSDLFFRLELIKRGLMVVAIIITFRWGINAMLMGQIVNSLIAYGINSYFSEQLIGYPMKSQIKDILPNLGFACAMAASMWWVGSLLNAPEWVKLFIQSISGMGIYALINYFSRSEPLFEFLELGKRYLRPHAAL